MVIAAVAAVIGAMAGDQERVSEMWISARLDGDGLAVTEVIDYDFGYQQRHGIYRTIPDLLTGAPITVSSPTAPDDVRIQQRIADTEIRVGDPSKTTWQRHRYQVDFTLDRRDVVVGSLFSWNAVGTEWTVDMANVRVVLSLDTPPTGVQCQRGHPWDSRPCAVDVAPSGLIEVELDELSAGDAVTISATVGGATPALSSAARSTPRGWTTFAWCPRARCARWCWRPPA